MAKFTLAAEGHGDPSAIRPAWEAFIEQLAKSGVSVANAPVQFIDTTDHVKERRLAEEKARQDKLRADAEAKAKADAEAARKAKPAPAESGEEG